MRVLHVTTPARFGGLEQVVTTLARVQREAGDEVHVTTLAETPAGQQFLNGLELRHIITHAGAAGERDYWGQGRHLRLLRRTIRPDVVHTHGYRADVLAAATGGPDQSAAVTTLHGFTGGDLKLRCYEWLQRRVVRTCDGIVAVSDAMAHELAQRGVPEDRLHVIPNIPPRPGPRLTRSEARRVLGVPDAACVLGWVGRLSKEKGLDLLLTALAFLEDPGIHLAILGDGSEREGLERMARDCGLTERLTWCGAVAGVDRFYAAFDAVVVSSRTEGSPLVVMEAMRAGVPVVATAVGGIPELTTPATASLVPPEDPPALAAAIRRVRCSPGRAARQAIRAHLRAARSHDPARWAARYRDVYATAIARHAEAG